MNDPKEPETLTDGDLDTPQGGAIFQTPAGGWGRKVRKGKTGSGVDEGAARFASTAGGSPNV
ncbi:MAG: hypothetical protein AAGE80_09450 [Pseudomonadota bacterium]